MLASISFCKVAKYLMIFTLVIFIVLSFSFYFYLKSIGIIPRKDYDTMPPVLSENLESAVLVFSKTNGFIHTDTIPVAKNVLVKIAEDIEKPVVVTDNAAVFNAEDLSKFSIVIWNNVSGDVLTESQRADFKQWLESGGSWLGLHASGGDFFYKWDWYVNTLLRAQFVGHNMNPQFQTATVVVHKDTEGITGHLGREWVVENEEWYAFQDSPSLRGSEILLSVDESSYSPSGRTWAGTDRMDGDHPVAWRHQVEAGKVLYIAIGHRAETYQSEAFQMLIKKALLWLEK